MSIVVTGGAGFIGSCIIKALNDNQYEDIIIVDDISTTEKWKNINGKKYIRYINKAVFWDKINELAEITHVIHMGACSSTTEKDFDYLWDNNVEFSKRLFLFCVEHGISFIYASSAATYGDGSNGFSDKFIDTLKPLNRYGYSKHIFDLWVEKQAQKPQQCVGLKFFNVYGPNEYHKNGMFSMIYQGYKQIEEYGEIKLFKSNHCDIKDGEQKRDFVYVKDICKLIIWFMQNKEISGLYNVGTGVARTFNDLAKSIFRTLKKESKIVYIDMPLELGKQYQNHTQASMEKLRAVGYNEEFYSLEEGIKDYVDNYLINKSLYW